MNNKGFTLIELIATIMILALVMSIASYSIINIINRSKEENYNYLLENIRNGAEVYYQECKYANNSGVTCTVNNGSYKITLGELLTSGYIKGNGKDNNNNYIIVNPKNNDSDIGDCVINVSFSDGKVKIVPEPSDGCPTGY